jgi:predicted RNA-binding protein with PIN domain
MRGGCAMLVPVATAEQLLVDGMNVIGSRPDGWWRDRDGAVRGLAERLRRLVSAEGSKVVLVLDGRPLADLPEGERGGLEVRYARRAGRNAADDRLVELVEGAAEPSALTVVTADRELRERLAAHGVRVLGPRTLLERLDAQGDA